MPKSSIARPTPIVRSSSSTAERDAPARHGAALGDLELQRCGGDAGVGEQRPDQPGQVRVEQVARRDVDRDAQLEALGAPGAALGDRGPQHDVGDARDQAGLLGERDEAVGPDAAERRVLPARERLDADGGAAAQRELRLVLEHELAHLDARGAAGRRASGGRPCSGPCRRSRPRRTAAPPSRRTARRRRCAAARRRRRRAPGSTASPTLARTSSRIPSSSNGCSSAATSRSADRAAALRVARRRRAGRRTRRRRGGRAGRRARARRAGAPATVAEQPVAVRVPERVVDRLEVVEVDEHQRERLAARRAPARARGRAARAAAGGSAGP